MKENNCSKCGRRFGLLQVRFQHHDIKGEVCEDCDATIERLRRVRKRLERSKQQ